MRINRPMMSGVVSVLTVAALLGGCGNPALSPLEGARSAQGLSASQALDEPDIPLNALPTEELQVPFYPSRSPQRITYGNSAKLHIFATQNLPALKSMISGAKQSVYVEVFNFANDSMGRHIVPLLVEKAKAGLEVKVVMDYVGSRFLKGHKAMIRELREAGVDVRNYRPRLVKKGDRKIGVNITHRKVYLVDGEVAMVGGVNLMAEFDTSVQDVLMEMRGPVVGQLYNEFAYDWHQAKGGTLKQVAKTARAGDVDARVVVTSPGEGRFEARDAFYDAVDEANREILIEQQYLWDDKLVHKLSNAVRRGVKLRVIVPGHSDSWKNIHAGELKRLGELGAQTRVYHGIKEDAHLHAKVIIVDDNWAVVGSINGDTRALIENQEIGVITRDGATVADLKNRMFERDWTHNSKPAVYSDKWYIKPVRSLMELIDYYL